jgi:hypothetical protein
MVNAAGAAPAIPHPAAILLRDAAVRHLQSCACGVVVV